MIRVEQVYSKEALDHLCSLSLSLFLRDINCFLPRKRRFPPGSYTWTHQCWPTSKTYNRLSCVGTGYGLETCQKRWTIGIDSVCSCVCEREGEKGRETNRERERERERETGRERERVRGIQGVSTLWRWRWYS